MKYKIIFAETAVEDLKNIGTYIAGYNPEKVSELKYRLENSAYSLEYSPYRGIKYNEEYRKLVVNKMGYIILYQVDEKAKEVIIAHFYNQRQEIPDGV